MFFGVLFIFFLIYLSKSVSNRAKSSSVNKVRKEDTHKPKTGYAKKTSYPDYVSKNKILRLSLANDTKKRLRYVIGEGFRVTKTDDTPESIRTNKDRSESSLVVFRPLGHDRCAVIVDKVRMCFKATGDERIGNCDDDRRNINEDHGWNVEKINDNDVILTNEDDMGEKLCLTTIANGKISMRECDDPYYNDQAFNKSHYTKDTDSKTEDIEEDFEVEDKRTKDNSMENDDNNNDMTEKLTRRNAPFSKGAYKRNPTRAPNRDHISDKNPQKDLNTSKISSKPEDLDPAVRQIYDLLKDIREGIDEKMKEILANPQIVDANEIIGNLLTLKNANMSPEYRQENVLGRDTGRYYYPYGS
ncbi:hypothetical protein THOM_1215 [Trachipleistophora hominis]|uniref:Uncharacterized protein n=1 Tax=Trachipleistophora hominis TaxID=72359 RepID=L7JYK6_TRAHO|nr:hypothetical protein THOM_1215 [Trachipleistophora hominis]